MITSSQETSLSNSLILHLRYVMALLEKDLAATPDEKFFDVASFATLRKPRDYFGECAEFNRYTTAMVRNQPFTRQTPEERLAYYETLDTKEKIISELSASVDELLGALEACTDSDFARLVETPWKEQISLSLLVSLCTGHLWYHDGQLNQWQCLYGDQQMHWLD